MFAGRMSELKRLDAMYDSNKFECVMMHGRMRVGKTTLLREFIKDKKAIYFAAQETSSGDNLENLARCVTSYRREQEPYSREIRSFEDVFDRVGKLALAERVLLVIDDYQFLAAAHRGVSELICNEIDSQLRYSRLMLIICGSSEQVMEAEALGYDSPFHGRRTAHMKLLPFSFFETKRYYGGFSPFDIAVIYGLTGGIPKYLELMDPELPIEENIQRAFFDTSSFLFEEPANFLRREVRDPTYYNSILHAIAIGRQKNSEIASQVGLETSACTAYLKNLISLGVVSKHTPLTEKAGKKTIYEIEDSMLRFWYRFIPDNMSLIMSGQADRIWRSVARDIPSFMATVFESICRQWLEDRNHSGRLPIKFIELGRWWGVDPVWKHETTLPIIAYADDDNAIFGDCVWSDEPAQVGALNYLAERSQLFRYTNRVLYLFSRSGFSEECAEAARRTGANLVMFE